MSIQTSRKGRRRRSIFSLLPALFVEFGAATIDLEAATALWSGGGANGTFTNSANWVGGARPVEGDDLLFLGTATQRTVTNVLFTPSSNYLSVTFAGSNYVIGNFEVNRHVFGNVDAVTMGALGVGVEGTNVFRENLMLANSNTAATIEVTATNGTLSFSNGLFFTTASKQVVKTGPGRVIVAGTGSLGNAPGSTVVNGGTWIDYRTNNNALGTAVYLTNSAVSAWLQVENPDALAQAATLRLHENATLWTKPVATANSLTDTAMILRGGRWTNSGAGMRLPTNIVTEASAQTAEIVNQAGINFSSQVDVQINVANGAAATDGLLVGNVGMVSFSLTKLGAGTLVMPNSLSGDLNLNQGTLRVSNVVAGAVNILSGATASITNLSATVLYNRGATVLGSNSFASQLLVEGGALTGGPLRIGASITSVGTSNVIAIPITLTSNARAGFSNASAGTLVFSGALITTNRILQLTNLAAKQTVVLAGDVFGNAAAIAGNYDILITNGECRVTGTNRAGTVIQASGANTVLSGTGGLKKARILNGATLAPGPGIATLYADGDVELDNDPISPVPGRLEIELQAANVHDKLIMNFGLLRLFYSGTTAELVLTKDPAFAAPAGTVLRIVELAGTSGNLAGTFTGLPQGATTNIGGTTFQISYTGGDGNDITLTVLAPPPAPRFATATRNGNNLTFAITNTVGAVNYLESLDILAEPFKWKRVATNSTPVSGLTNFVTAMTNNPPTRYFRLGSP